MMQTATSGIIGSMRGCGDYFHCTLDRPLSDRVSVRRGEECGMSIGLYVDAMYGR